MMKPNTYVLVAVTLLLAVTLLGCKHASSASSQGGLACPQGQHFATQDGLVDTRPWELQTGNRCVQILETGEQVDQYGVHHTTQTCYYCTT